MKPVVEPASSADYRPSHSGLLGSLYGPGRPALPPPGSPLHEYGPRLGQRRPDTGRPVGGVVVPTGRDFSETERGLLFAAEIALRHACPLIVIHSRDARAAEFPRSVRTRLGDSLVLIDLETVHPSWRPGLASASDDLSGLHRSNDVGWKRNLGIMAAVRLGWEFVLFLDDDISPATDENETLDPEHLAHALRVMRADDQVRATGWPLVRFDDNSVVGHARPLVGLPQDIFISSGALLLRVDEHTAFFPEGVYNEDWLLLIQTMAQARAFGRALTRGGPVRQKPYPAFCPVRARSEEVGELLGEGLMNLVEDHGPGFSALVDRRYWRRVMDGRRSLLHQIIRGKAEDRLLLWHEEEAPKSTDAVVECMNTALWTHRQVTPRMLAKYAKRWQADWQVWRNWLAGLTKEAADRTRAADLPDLLLKPYTPETQGATAQGWQGDPSLVSIVSDSGGWEALV